MTPDVHTDTWQMQQSYGNGSLTPATADVAEKGKRRGQENWVD